MTGNPAGISNRDRFIRRSSRYPSGGDSAASLRRFLVQLALNPADPISVVEQAVQAVADALGGTCSFIECEVVPQAGPGHTAIAVYTQGSPFGALLVSTDGVTRNGLTNEDLKEISDLVGLCLLHSSHARALIELQSESEDMLFHAPDAIFVLQPDGTVQMANRRALDLVDSNTDDIDGRHISQLLSAEALTEVPFDVLARKGEQVEIEIGGTSGRKLVNLTFSTVGDGDLGQVLCVIRDVTRERQAQLAIRRAERTSLMGKTVEYLLHELNNPLAALVSNLGQMQKKFNGLRKFSQDLDKHSGQLSGGEAQASTDRFSSLLHQMSQFLDGARQSSSRLQTTMATLRNTRQSDTHEAQVFIDIGFELGIALSAAEQEAAGRVTIRRDIEPLPKVQGAPLQLAEAFGAIIKNAVQEVEQCPGGEVRIQAGMTRDNQIQIAINDNGRGVPKDIIDHIFMPFFTTKPLGEALGLGLTIAEDTMRRVGGSIVLEQPQDTGACFKVIIPI